MGVGKHEEEAALVALRVPSDCGNQDDNDFVQAGILYRDVMTPTGRRPIAITW